MKRNILLLTAVVLAAVMLAGCSLWPFGKVTVKVEVPKKGENALVEITDLAKGGKYKKEAKVTLTAKYTKDWNGEKIVWSADDEAIGKINPTPIPSDEDDNVYVGQKLEFVLGKKDVKITGKEVENGN